MSTLTQACPHNHDWRVFKIDDTSMYIKATHHGGDCWVDFVKRGDYVIGALDYHHKKCANSAMLTAYTTGASLLAAVLIPPIGIPATAGSTASQTYANAKAAGYQNAYIDLITFLTEEKEKAEKETNYVDVPIVNIHRATNVRKRDRYLMRKTAAAVMPSGQIPDIYHTKVVPGDRFRIEFTSGIRTSRLPNGKDYHEINVNTEDS